MDKSRCAPCEHLGKGGLSDAGSPKWCENFDVAPEDPVCPFHPLAVLVAKRRREVAAALVLDNTESTIIGQQSLNHLVGLGLKPSDSLVQEVCIELRNMAAVGLNPTDVFRADADALLDRERIARDVTSAGRNDSCPCGSGRKYKKCCLLKH